MINVLRILFILYMGNVHVCQTTILLLLHTILWESAIYCCSCELWGIYLLALAKIKKLIGGQKSFRKAVNVVTHICSSHLFHWLL